MNGQITPAQMILQQYLSQYNPWTIDSTTPPPLYKTSEDIVRELSDMIDIDINVVAAAMIANGYKLELTPARRGWMLTPINSKP